MRSFRVLIGLLFALALTAGAHAQDVVAVPPLTAHVTDQAGMLDAQQRDALENVLKDYETRTGSQVAILLVASTAPEAIEQYSIRVADAWKLGRKKVDDGVILLVARDNPSALRRLRIEAGRGVQGTLTDAQSRRILADVIAPHFRQKDYYGGLSAGVSAITTLLDQAQLPAAAGASSGAKTNDAEDSFLGVPIPVIIFIAVFIFIVLQARKQGRGLSSNGWGRSSGVILGGGAGSSWGSSGGSSGGGFSGGGGGFDGGGSSGDW